MTTVTLNNPDALLLPRDVAALRCMTENALAIERWRGAGPRFVKIGRRVLYRAGDLADFITAHTIEPRPPVPQQD
ncbi:hypothetical protein [Mycobacterium avium]|uniref:DNA-binding protein n=1 Tax=Mycobacterium avium TaxID=1764 RepID=A0A2A2ZLF4_MYCAV|nr:hypothetical protein [Mycobacterium avium]ETZ52588.1 putative phage transcriptional regulator [Mycobacterium avium MAV_120709_2344]MCA4736177.1 DNA-binding protein [Mycobacterium avium subsp. hominissuis]MCA4740863.1 DNA-binding protein [Mycobacterium avium subsp. hominissuis]MCA4745310.1 DNA-binding protein [Mycobacterium avium subsp. hominissuis]MCA4765156.1 DNA-binding protein [Mycobacterium avium subsp. hominissuis]